MKKRRSARMNNRTRKEESKGLKPRYERDTRDISKYFSDFSIRSVREARARGRAASGGSGARTSRVPPPLPMDARLTPSR